MLLQVKRVPLDRLMVETDAPYLGFTGCRKGHSKPKKQVRVIRFPLVRKNLNRLYGKSECRQVPNRFTKYALISA